MPWGWVGGDGHRDPLSPPPPAPSSSYCWPLCPVPGLFAKPKGNPPPPRVGVLPCSWFSRFSSSGIPVGFIREGTVPPVQFLQLLSKPGGGWPCCVMKGPRPRQSEPPTGGASGGAPRPWPVDRTLGGERKHRDSVCNDGLFHTSVVTRSTRQLTCLLCLLKFSKRPGVKSEFRHF